MDARPVDLERLRRALHLAATRVRHGEYRVHGHVVKGTDVLTCDCADAAMRPAVTCKHALAVLLRRGDPEVLAALAALVPVKAPREAKRPPRRPGGPRSPRRTYPLTGAAGGLTG